VARAATDKFDAIGFGAAWFVVIVQPGGTHRHLPGRLEIHPVLREWMLYSLILPDRAIEYHAVARIFCGAAECVLADSNRFGRNQDALGIEAVQNI
jgi:hypothetical protein